MRRPWTRLPSRLVLTTLGLWAGLSLVSNACDSHPQPTQPGPVTSPPVATNAPQTPAPSDNETVAPTPTPPAPISIEEILVGAGDIADCTRSGPGLTANLLDRLAGTIFTAGDNVYMNGTPSEFADCYGPSWGRHRARTRPAPGNHDYGTPDASGYFQYFGPAAGPPGQGYYSYDLGAWHIVSLNTNVAIHPGSAQISWLQTDLTSHATRCSLAYFHHPLFSSGQNGSDSRQRDVWRVLHAHGVDVIVSAHDHVYERFAPQDADGRFDPVRGVRQFTVGTGGGKLYGFPNLERNSEVRGSVWGVIRFALRAGDYSWEFIAVDGETFKDSGQESCH
ncbi:MAG: metallophosphoesterase [Vicinamibacterales bacterium]